MGRGCDAMGMRSVARANAQYAQAMVDFESEYGEKITKLQAEISKKLNQKEGNKDTTNIQKDLDKAREDYNNARIDKNAGEWRPLREAMASAQNHNRMWTYWYQLIFLIGTVILTGGVLTLAFTGEGIEKWFGLIVAVIIVFSIYIGGTAWIESIITSAQSADIRPNIPVPNRGGGMPDFN
jgi:hypothetical protein